MVLIRLEEKNKSAVRSLIVLSASEGGKIYIEKRKKEQW